MKIQPIVEGHGEVEAVPVLLRRLLNDAGIYSVTVAQSFRRKQSQLRTEEGLRTAIELARLDQECTGIIVIFEDEDDCPKTLGPRLSGWAKAAANPLPCIVALPHREYEAWFLAAIRSLRGKRGIRPDALLQEEPESIRAAKGALERLMIPNSNYLETSDQAALSALFDFKEAYRNSRSFRHLVKALCELVNEMGIPLGNWPPQEWADT